MINLKIQLQQTNKKKLQKLPFALLTSPLTAAQIRGTSNPYLYQFRGPALGKRKEEERRRPKACFKFSSVHFQKQFSSRHHLPFCSALAPKPVHFPRLCRNSTCVRRAVSICRLRCLLCRSRCTASNWKKMEMFSYDHPSAFLHLGLYCVCPLLSDPMKGAMAEQCRND